MRIDVEQRRPVAAGQVGAPDRALEEDVAGEDRGLVGDRVGDVAGAVARREDHVDLHPRELELLAAGHRVIGVIALVRAEAGPGNERVDVGEDRRLDLRAPDRRARRLRDRSDGADVVEVGVGEQDPVDRDAELL